MTNVKISELPAKNNPDGGEELLFAEAGNNGKITLDKVKEYVGSGGGGTDYQAGDGISISGFTFSEVEGYHIPTKAEWTKLKSLMTDLGVMARFSEYLKIPLTGYRVESGAVQGNNEYSFWASTTTNNGKADSVYGASGSMSHRPENPGAAMSIRLFYDTPQYETFWPVIYQGTGEDGIYYNEINGFISVHVGDETITIADKNVGATEVWNLGDELTPTNTGYTFQWGNYYGFPSTVDTAQMETSAVQAHTAGYNATTLQYADNVYRTISVWSEDANLLDLWDEEHWYTAIALEQKTISNTGVLSVNGQTGHVTIQAGEGLQETQYRTSDLLEAPIDSEDVAQPLIYNSNGTAFARIYNNNNIHQVELIAPAEPYGTTGPQQDMITVPFEVKGVIFPIFESYYPDFNRKLIIFGDKDIISYYNNPDASDPVDPLYFSDAVEVTRTEYDADPYVNASIKSSYNLETCSDSSLSLWDGHTLSEFNIIGGCNYYDTCILYVSLIIDDVNNPGNKKQALFSMYSNQSTPYMYFSDDSFNYRTSNELSIDQGTSGLIGINSIYSKYIYDGGHEFINMYISLSGVGENVGGYVMYGSQDTIYGGYPSSNWRYISYWNKFNNSITTPIYYLDTELGYYNSKKWFISDERYMSYKMIDKLSNIYLNRGNLFKSESGGDDNTYSANYINNALNNKQNKLSGTIEIQENKIKTDNFPLNKMTQEFYIGSGYGITFYGDGTKMVCNSNQFLGSNTIAVPYAPTYQEIYDVMYNRIDTGSLDFGQNIVSLDGTKAISCDYNEYIRVWNLSTPYDVSTADNMIQYDVGQAKLVDYTGTYFWVYERDDNTQRARFAKYACANPYEYDMQNATFIEWQDLRDPILESISFQNSCLMFSFDGKFILGRSTALQNNNYRMIELGTAWDLSTAINSYFITDYGTGYNTFWGVPSKDAVYGSIYGPDTQYNWTYCTCTVDKTNLYPSWNKTTKAAAEGFAPVTDSTSTSTLTISNLTTVFEPTQDFTLAAGTVMPGMSYVVRLTSGATAYNITLDSTIDNPYGETLTLTANKTTTIVLLAVSGTDLEIMSVRTAQ